MVRFNRPSRVAFYLYVFCIAGGIFVSRLCDTTAVRGAAMPSVPLAALRRYKQRVALSRALTRPSLLYSLHPSVSHFTARVRDGRSNSLGTQYSRGQLGQRFNAYIES